MGGHVIVCKDCGHKHYIFHSCGHSHCMLCQSIKREQWVDKLRASLLQVPYIHMTFTLPHGLNMLAKLNKTIIYSLIHKTAWQTVQQIAQQQETTYGMTSVLHTFGSDMKYHVHIHALVTFGGLAKSGDWIYPTVKNKIAKYRFVCVLYKELFLKELSCLHHNSKLVYHSDFDALLDEVKKQRWVVHATYPTMDTELVQNYLARYINRVAISNNRLSYLKSQQAVTILYNDYAQQKEGQPAPKSIKYLQPIEAINQILQHVLPPYFQKSRRYGLHHHSCNLKSTIPTALKNNNQTIRTIFQILNHLLQSNPFECEKCQSKNFFIQEIDNPEKYNLAIIFIDSLKSPPAHFLHTRSILHLALKLDQLPFA